MNLHEIYLQWTTIITDKKKSNKGFSFLVVIFAMTVVTVLVMSAIFAVTISDNTVKRYVTYYEKYYDIENGLNDYKLFLYNCDNEQLKNAYVKSLTVNSDLSYNSINNSLCDSHLLYLKSYFDTVEYTDLDEFIDRDVYSPIYFKDSRKTNGMSVDIDNVNKSFSLYEVSASVVNSDVRITVGGSMRIVPPKLLYDNLDIYEEEHKEILGLYNDTYKR